MKLKIIPLALDLIEKINLVEPFRDELTKFHRSIPIAEVSPSLVKSLERSDLRTMAIENREFEAIVLRSPERIRDIEQSFMKSGELLGLSREELKLKIFPPLDSLFKIRSGDVLAIHAFGLTPMTGPEEPMQTIILQAGSAAPVKGLPFTVSEEGKISLPILGEFNVGGMTPSQAQKAILEAYIKAEVFTKESLPGSDVEVAFLSTVGSRLEIRQIVGPAVELPRREDDKSKK